MSEDKSDSETIVTSTGLGWRHILVLLANLGLAVVYGMRSNLSIALVAMVNDTTDLTPNHTDVSCPENIVPPGPNATAPAIPGGEFPWPRELQGFILSAFFFGYLITQIPGGILAQRFGGKIIFAIGIACTGVLTLLTPLAANVSPYCLIALRILMGLGEGVTYPALTSVLGLWTPQSESTFLFAIAFSGGQLGTILGQLVAGPLCASNWGWSSVFYITGAAALLWLIPWCLLVTDRPRAHRFISPAECEYIESSAAKEIPHRSLLDMPWKQILTDRAVWAYTVCVFVNSWKFYTLLTCLPQFLSDILHFDIKSNGIISTLPYIGNFAMQFVASWLADAVIRSERVSRTGIRKIFTGIGLGSITIFMLGAVFTGCDVYATVAMLVIMLTIGAFDLGGFSPNPLDLSPEFCGTLTGFANTFGIIAGIIAPLITDGITTHHSRQEWAIVFYLTSAIAGLGVIVFSVFGSGERRYWFSDVEEDRLSVNHDYDLLQEDNVVI